MRPSIEINYFLVFDMTMEEVFSCEHFTRPLSGVAELVECRRIMTYHVQYLPKLLPWMVNT